MAETLTLPRRFTAEPTLPAVFNDIDALFAAAPIAEAMDEVALFIPIAPLMPFEGVLKWWCSNTDPLLRRLTGVFTAVIEVVLFAAVGVT